MVKYCASCGSPTKYLSQPPTSCSDCGAVYAPAITPTVIPKQRLNTNTIYMPQGDMYGSSEEQKLEELKASITELQLVEGRRPKSQTREPDTVGALWGKGLGDGFVRPNPVGNKKRVSNKQIIEEFKKEATPIHTRQNPINIGPEE